MITESYLILSRNLIRDIVVMPGEIEPTAKYKSLRQFVVPIYKDKRFVIDLMRSADMSDNEISHISVNFVDNAKSTAVTRKSIETKVTMEDDKNLYTIRILCANPENTRLFRSFEDVYAWIESRIKDGRISTHTTFTVPMADTQTVNVKYNPTTDELSYTRTAHYDS